MEITIKNNQRLVRINKQRIEKILKKALRYLALNHRSYSFLKSAEISVLFVNDRRMGELNLQYRGKDKTTDVLSFSQLETITPNSEFLTPNFVLGDIVINLPQAKRQALEQGLTLYAEVSWLLIHGLLHLLGYDHEKNKYQAKKMRAMEKELLGDMF